MTGGCRYQLTVLVLESWSANFQALEKRERGTLFVAIQHISY